MERQLIFELPNDLRCIEETVDFVISRCSTCEEVARKLRLNFRVGLTEALSNEMIYGNSRDPSKRVRVEVFLRAGSVTARVLQEMADSLMDELESTEMYLTLFYGVVDPRRSELLYANAGHPHAFAIRGDGSAERLAALDPPMGIAGNVDYHQRAVA